MSSQSSRALRFVKTAAVLALFANTPLCARLVPDSPATVSGVSLGAGNHASDGALEGVLGARNLAPLASPDGRLTLSVALGNRITYSVSDRDGVLLENNSIGLKIMDFPKEWRPVKVRETRDTLDRVVRPVVPFRAAEVRDHCNRLVVEFRDGISVEFRVYDDGFAYRFITSIQGKIDVLGEDFRVNFPDGSDYFAHYQDPTKRGLATCYEEDYSHKEISKLDSWALLPLLIDSRRGPKILISETGLLDYPNTFLKRNQNGLEGFCPPVPAQTRAEKGRYIRAVGDAGHIARTNGTREFPWRYFIITRKDSDLLAATMPARLAPSCALSDTSWIRPGLSAWDWLNRSRPFGPEVKDYKREVSTRNAKLYIDYAAKHKIPYYIIDEGWSVDTGLPMKTRPAVDLPEIVRYGREKGVGIVLWITYLGIQRSFDGNPCNLFEYFSKMGVAGFKIDFMDRSDQDIVNFYERAAAEAAKYKMIIELHGSYKPSGLEYKYPNVLSYEGVRGLEGGLGVKPDNSLYLPFMRNVTGPMSFTPGSVVNRQPGKKQRADLKGLREAYGTRACHLAYYVLFESGLQMISESPVLLEKNPDCANFIHTAPVTWHETVPLAAEVGKYALSARRNGEKWWIGGLANSEKKSREFSVKLDFLPAGKTYLLTAIEDGPDAAEDANSHKVTTRKVTRADSLKIAMACNGGYAARLDPVE
ncbi:MAG: glycoside hydrolase family 97 protein [Puniceicoccales bacterium]|jgi:alpha-glucosidase|nr:glycoside hydrolase family 97 protein [Puniceicoccales bacterium]